MTQKTKIIKKLKLNKNFKPLPVDEEDELFPNGIFLFNITKMLESIHTHPDIFIPEKISVKEFHSSLINEDYMNSVKSTDPVLIAEIAPGRYNLIDGNHRIEKARRMGMENIMAYRLNVNHHINFLTTQESYVAYVKYWNSKLKDL